MTANGAVEDSQSVSFDLEPGLAEATFSASWSSGSGEVMLLRPDGNVVTTSAPATSIVDQRTHRIFRVGLPDPGRWSLRIGKSERGLRCTASATTPSQLRLVARVRPGRRATLLVHATLRVGAEGLDDARVTARLVRPRLRLEEVLERHADALEEIQLDERVDERGLSDRTRRLVALAILGAQIKRGPGGLFDREVVELELEPQGDGHYATLVDLPAPGTVRADIVATGDVDGFRWQRHAHLSSVVGQSRSW